MSKCSQHRPPVNHAGVAKLVSDNSNRGALTPVNVAINPDLSERLPLFTGIEEGHAYNLPFLIPDYDFIISQLGVIGLIGLLEVETC